MIRVLIACEESQAICTEFRKRGHEAFSCDLKPCSGGHPEWHIQGDALALLDRGWDLLIAHPVCTYLTAAGASFFNILKYGDKAIKRWHQRIEAAEFFYRFWQAPIEHVAIENPLGFMNTPGAFRKPDCTVQPWEFGDRAQKRTCFWLRGLPPLMPTALVDKGDFYYWTDKHGKLKREPMWFVQPMLEGKSQAERSTIRSKTFPGIAAAIADQWGGYVETKKQQGTKQ